MIIDKYKTIFIHIPKNAGTSIEMFFSNIMIKYWEDVLRIQPSRHDTIDMIKRKFPSIYNSHTKFAVIRNPYDRMVSWYFFIKRNALGNVTRPIVSISDDDGAYFPIDGKAIEFNEWIKDPTSFLDPQQSWVDETVKIIKFENLNKELNEFFKEEIDLPVANKSDHDHYLKYYNQKSLDIVYDRYKEDFKRFNYERIKI